MLPAIGLGVGLIGMVGKAIGRGKANREMDKLLKENPAYTANPEAAKRLGLAQTLLNARMPGSAAVEKNIYGTQAGTIDNINRNATDSSQALALASGVQGQTNDAFNQLGVQEAQDYQRRLHNLTGAQEGVIREGDKVYGDQVRRFHDKANVKAAQNENRQNTWGDISNFGFGLMDFGLNGGQDELFGKQGQGSSQGGYSGLTVGRGGPISPIKRNG